MSPAYPLTPCAAGGAETLLQTRFRTHGIGRNRLTKMMMMMAAVNSTLWSKTIS